MPCGIVRSSHIGTGQLGKFLNKYLTLYTGAHIAAINQDVGIIAQSVLPSLEFTTHFIYIVKAQRTGTELQTGRPAMGDNMYGLKTGVPCKLLGDLTDTISSRDKGHHSCLG